MMRIWLTLPNLATQSGGPVNTVQHLSAELARLGAAVNVLTSSPTQGEVESLPEDPRVRVHHVSADKGHPWEAAWAFKRVLNCEWVRSGIDVVHDFGLWRPQNHGTSSAARKLGIPWISSPSGMLSTWALGHKKWKKRLAMWLYQYRDLSRASALVATSRQESQDIRHLFPRKVVPLVPRGVNIPEARNADQAAHDRCRKLVFLGRIHPVKGLDNLVKAWAIARPKGWSCVIAGPDEGGHQRQLEQLMIQQGTRGDFEFPGMVVGASKWRLLREADLFVLPSHTENFGIAMAEALAAGVPGIATRATPWQGLVERRCGWWVQVGVDPLARALQEGTSLPDEQRQAMGRRAREWVTAEYSWPRVARQTLALYQWLLGVGHKPEFV